MTREERNVLIFLTVGILLGSWPRSDRDEVVEAPVLGNGTADGTAEPVVVDLFPIDLNRASVDLLAELPGIGPAKASAIVERRRTAGPFRTVEELAEVRGIGPKTVERLRNRVTLTDTGIEERESNRVGEPTGDPPSGERGPHDDPDGAGEEPGEVDR